MTRPFASSRRISGSVGLREPEFQVQVVHRRQERRAVERQRAVTNCFARSVQRLVGHQVRDVDRTCQWESFGQDTRAVVVGVSHDLQKQVGPRLDLFPERARQLEARLPRSDDRVSRRSSSMSLWSRTITSIFRGRVLRPFLSSVSICPLVRRTGLDPIRSGQSDGKVLF